MNCMKCGKNVHWCPNCGLTPDEEFPYENDVCDECFNKSGAKKIYDEVYYNLKSKLDEAQDSISEAIENYTYNGAKK